eukprot:c10924_g1_i1.p1 GENE.c10924_g1_i1~~c10924_g1_i1.p1  ORF type:complete len:151 (+),score=22.30 c10924_g1_i1:2-454(+)
MGENKNKKNKTKGIMTQVQSHVSTPKCTQQRGCLKKRSNSQCTLIKSVKFGSIDRIQFDYQFMDEDLETEKKAEIITNPRSSGSSSSSMDWKQKLRIVQFASQFLHKSFQKMIRTMVLVMFLWAVKQSIQMRGFRLIFKLMKKRFRVFLW